MMIEIDLFFDRRRGRTVGVVKSPNREGPNIIESVMAEHDDPISIGERVKLVLDPLIDEQHQLNVLEDRKNNLDGDDE